MLFKDSYLRNIKISLCYHPTTVVLVDDNKDFLNHIINYLNCQNGETVGLFSNAYPCFNTYLTDGKEFIKSRLRPNKIMMNYIDYTLNNLAFRYSATLRIIGEGGAHTAMAKTVGLPLALGAIAILDGIIKERGCLMPFNVVWGKQILLQLEELGIQFAESTQQINN